MKIDRWTSAALVLCAGAAMTATGTAAAQNMSDAGILGHELAANQGEVQLGQWVSQHTQNAAVRAYADMLARDHGNGARQVQATASQAGITPDPAAAEEPRQETQETLARLGSMTGAEMDRAFVEHAVTDHRKDISDTETAIAQAQNPAVRTLLENTMPVLRTHLARAEALQRGMGGARQSMGVRKDAGR